MRYKLANGVYIVRVNTHYVAVSVAVEIFDRQFFHLVEHFVAHISQKPLRENRAELTEQQTRYPAERVNPEHCRKDYKHVSPCFVRRAAFKNHIELFIQILKENTCDRTRYRADHKTDTDSEKQTFIILKKQAYHSLKRTEIGFSAHMRRRFFSVHCCRFSHSVRLLRFRCFYSENSKLLCKFRLFQSVVRAIRPRLSFRFP